MTEPSSTHAPAEGAAPPTSPRGVLQRAKAWPTVIGVVSLMFAVMGLLGAMVGLSTPLWEGAMRAATPGAASKAAWDQFSTLNVVIGVAAVPMAGLVCAGAVQVLRRRLSGRTLLRVWAVLSLPLAVLSGAAVYNFELEQVRGQMAAQATAGSPIPPGIAETVSGVMGVVTLGWGAAWPLFVLVWFARAKVREDCRGWATART